MLCLPVVPVLEDHLQVHTDYHHNYPRVLLRFPPLSYIKELHSRACDMP